MHTVLCLIELYGSCGIDSNLNIACSFKDKISRMLCLYFLPKLFGICQYYWSIIPINFYMRNRVQRKSFLQLAIRASWSQHLLAQMSFQLAPKAFWPAELISQFFFNLNSSKTITCLSGKLRREFTSPIAKSTSPRLSDTTFFARCLIIKWENFADELKLSSIFSTSIAPHSL